MTGKSHAQAEARELGIDLQSAEYRSGHGWTLELRRRDGTLDTITARRSRDVIDLLRTWQHNGEKLTPDPIPPRPLGQTEGTKA